MLQRKRAEGIAKVGVEGSNPFARSKFPTRRVQRTRTDGMQALTVVRTVADLRRAVAEFRSAGRTIGMIPTMGALHRGHTSLVQGALDRGDVPVASIFVNPTQFGAQRGFRRLPARRGGRPAAKLDAAGLPHRAFAPGRRGDVSRPASRPP